MKKSTKIISTVGGMLVAIALLVSSFAFNTQAAEPAMWDTTGSYVVNMEYLGSQYGHDMVLNQDSLGNLTGNGGSPAGANIYLWVITSGTVSGNTIDFLADYTDTADAVSPQAVLHIVGTIANDGTVSGTWSDNYQGGTRTGAITTATGAALPLGILDAEDFGVVSYDTGLGMLSGYTAGFGLTDATFENASSVVVELYSAGDVLMQTNTAILPKFNADITGTQISSPFDVSGAFDYAIDGYWTNVREVQYGQSVPATKVVATVTLANDKVVKADNINLTGDPTTIYPIVVNVTTDAATDVLATTATVNGTNGPSDASETSFWIGTTPAGPFIPSTTPETELPSGWYGVDSLEQLAYASFNHTYTDLSSNTQYYFVAWSNVDGTWYPGDVLNFTTDFVTPPTPPTPTIPTDKNQCKNGGWKSFTGQTFKNQGQCVSYVQANEHAANN